MRLWIDKAWIKDKFIEILAFLLALYSFVFPRTAAPVEVPRTAAEDQRVEQPRDPVSSGDRPRGGLDPGITAIQQVISEHRNLLSWGFMNADALAITLPRLQQIEQAHGANVFLQHSLQGARGLVTEMGPLVVFDDREARYRRSGLSVPHFSFVRQPGPVGAIEGGTVPSNDEGEAAPAGPPVARP